MFEKYSEYIDSGVKWLGHVPNNWELTRLGTRFEERRTKVSDRDFPPLSVTKNGILPQLDSAAKSNDGDNRKLVKSGDFVINSRSDRKGSSGVSNLDGSVSLINIVMEPKNLNSRFCHYYLKSYSFIEEFYRMGHGIVADLWTTRYDEMKAIIVAIPSLDEQTAIANFLDRKTAQIDQAISVKEKQIELLNERKQILIHNAVTRGLDPGVKMKDSGVEWIGAIPEHWEVFKLTHCVSLVVDGTHFSPKSFDEGDYKYITAKNIKENGFDFSDLSYISEKDHRIIYKRCPVKQNDILYIKDGATAGIATINTLEEEFSMLSSVALIRPNVSILNPLYLKYYLNSHAIKAFMNTQLVGGAMTRLTIELIKEYKVIIPPSNEQLEIANSVSHISNKIANAISIKQKEIEKLKEYKSTLINSAVTGKIKVS